MTRVKKLNTEWGYNKNTMNKENSLNLTWSTGEVTYEDRCKLLNQNGLVIWFTGISGSGKSTISIEVEKVLINKGILVYRLDGDNIRHGLCSDLGFSEEDRRENIRRIAEVATLFCDAGLITLVCAIAPNKKMRDYAREKVGKSRFIEVYIKASLEACIKRDPKGLYRKALNDQISNFTGISSIYEEPKTPELIVNTEENTLEVCVKKVLEIYRSFNGVI